MKPFAYLKRWQLLLLLAPLLLNHKTLAQASRPKASTLYADPEEKLAELPTGGGLRAIAGNIQRSVRQSALTARERQVRGRVCVSFQVTAAGRVRAVKIWRGLGPAQDSAVVRAVRALPRFRPGTQVGRPVPNLFTVPVLFPLFEPRENVE